MRQSGAVHIRERRLLVPSRGPAGPVAAFSAFLVLAMSLAACAGSPPSPVEATHRVGLSLVQQRTDEGTSRVHLRVTNREENEIAVTGIGVEWPGFPGLGITDYETVVRPGLTVDLPFSLPDAACAPADDRPVGVVRIDTDVVRRQLDRSGVRFLRRAWDRECTKRSVTDRVEVRFGDRWRKTYVDRRPALVGILELTRRSGEDRLTVLGYEGSVLLDVAGRVPFSLPPDARRTSERVLVSSTGRCDPHSLSESKQTFLFRVEVRIGGGEPVRLMVSPDQRMQAQAWDLLAEACG